MPSAAAPGRVGLWLGSWKHVEWVLWATYLFVPVLITAFLTPVELWSNASEVGGEYLCNLTGTLCVAGLAHVLYAAISPRAGYRREANREWRPRNSQRFRSSPI